jgi:hypothetical protein
VLSPIAPSCKNKNHMSLLQVNIEIEREKKKRLTCNYVVAYQMRDRVRSYEPIPMLLVMNHNEADSSKSYQQVLSAQSTPPRKYQPPLHHH